MSENRERSLVSIAVAAAIAIAASPAALGVEALPDYTTLFDTSLDWSTEDLCGDVTVDNVAPVRHAAEMAACVEIYRNVYGRQDTSNSPAWDDYDETDALLSAAGESQGVCADEVTLTDSPCTYWGRDAAGGEDEDDYEAVAACSEFISRSFGLVRRTTDPGATPRLNYNHTTFPSRWCHGVMDQDGSWEYPIFDQLDAIDAGACTVDDDSGGTWGYVDKIDAEDGHARCRGTPLSYAWEKIIATAGEYGVSGSDESCGVADLTPDLYNDTETRWPFTEISSATDIEVGDLIAITYENECGAEHALYADGGAGEIYTFRGWQLIGGTSFNLCTEYDELDIWDAASDATPLDMVPSERQIAIDGVETDPLTDLEALCDEGDLVVWDDDDGDWSDASDLDSLLCGDEDVTGHVVLALTEAQQIGTIDFEVELDQATGAERLRGASALDPGGDPMSDAWILIGQSAENEARWQGALPPDQRGVRWLESDPEDGLVLVEELPGGGESEVPVPDGARLLYIDHPLADRYDQAAGTYDPQQCVRVLPFREPATPGGTCESRTRLPTNLHGQAITGAWIDAALGSARPAQARIERVMGPAPAASGWLPTASERGWSSAVTGDLNCSGGGCTGWYSVELDPGPGQDCADFTPVKVCFDMKNTMAQRRVDTAAVCEDGVGVFQLVRWGLHDRGADGLDAAVYWPAMLYGTGSMTNQAWITDVKSLAPGVDLRIVKSGQDFQFDGDDRLMDAGAVSLAMTTQPTPVPPGALTGSSPIVAQGLVEEDLDLTVRLRWECSNDPQSWIDATPPEPRYMLDLSEAGCEVEQKLTLISRGGHVAVAPYGNPNWELPVPTADTPVGRAFLFEYGALRVRGTLDEDPQEPTLAIEEVTAHEIEVCAPGLYPLSAM